MDPLDLEEQTQYLRQIDNRRTDNGNVDLERNDLEPPGVYLHRASKAAVRLSKARAANWVAIILVVGLVLSLPLAVFATMYASTEQATLLDSVFEKWYAVVSPILGAVVGALFGISIASKLKDDTE